MKKNMSLKRWLACCLLLPMLLVAACSTFNWQKPSIQLSNISLGKTSLLTQDLTIELRISNPNNRALSAQGLNFVLTSQGKTLASGQSQQAIAIPALGEGTVSLDVHASIIDWIQRVRATIQQGQSTLDYQISGQLQGVDGFPAPISFKHDQQLDLSRFR